MTEISPLFHRQLTANDAPAIGADLSFEQQVQQYIEQNQPDGSLDELLSRLKAMSDSPLSLQQLTNALLYADTALRSNPDFQSYTDSVLDKHTSQLCSVNMLYNRQLNDFLESSDSENEY